MCSRVWNVTRTRERPQPGLRSSPEYLMRSAHKPPAAAAVAATCWSPGPRRRASTWQQYSLQPRLPVPPTPPPACQQPPALAAGAGCHGFSRSASPSSRAVALVGKCRVVLAGPSPFALAPPPQPVGVISGCYRVCKEPFDYRRWEVQVLPGGVGANRRHRSANRNAACVSAGILRLDGHMNASAAGRMTAMEAFVGQR